MLSLSLLIGGFSFIISAEVSKSTFLFCLKPEIEPLSIIKNESQLLVDNQILQSFINDNQIINIGPDEGTISINELVNLCDVHQKIPQWQQE